MKNYIYENFETNNLTITEGASANLREGVLAKVKGPSFFSDGFSRNGRFYPKKLWENALKNSETKTKLDRKLMFGCIGHPKDYTLDNLLESGKVSHIVTDIYMDKKTGEGIAEYEILDTPSGRILNTVLKSGSEMYVSTRAFGGFTNETKEKDGRKYKILDDSNFVIESIDFVIEPGFLDTNPKLVETLEEDLGILRADEHHIECTEGLCSLQEDLQRIVEAKIDAVTVTEVAEEVVDKEVKEEMKIEEIKDGEEIHIKKVESAHDVDFSALVNLSKDDIVNMFKNVVYENKLLSEAQEEEAKTNTDVDKSDDNKNSDEVEIDSKRLMNYLSYLELLIKMVKYNTGFEKYYEDLIEVMDKDDKLTVKDMETVVGIIDEILKEEDLDESIEKIAAKIKEMYNKINNIDTDKEEKDTKKEETFVDFVLSLKTQVVERVTLKEDATKVNSQKSQIMRLKEATISLTAQLEESINKEPDTIEKVITEIEYKVPKEVTERIGVLNGKIIALQNDKTTLSEASKKSTKEHNEMLDNRDELLVESRDKVEQLESELTSVKEDHTKILDEVNDSYAKELRDSHTENNDLEKQVNELLEDRVTLTDKFESLVKKKDLVIETNTKLKEELTSSEASYLSSVYRLDKKIVEKLMDTYEGKALESALNKEKRLIVKESLIKEDIEVPEYKPNNESLRKGKMLDRLI